MARPDTGTARAGHGGRTARSIGLLGAVAVLVVVVLLSIAVGTRTLPLDAVWCALWGDDGSEAAAIVHTLRLPRTALGLVAGAALGLAGALMQALTRNPLADPGLLGVEMGAATAVAVAIATGAAVAVGVVPFALAGAAVAAVFVYLLGTSGAGRRGAGPERLLIAGSAVNAVLIGLVSALLLLAPLAFGEFRFWNVGSVAGRHWAEIVPVLPVIAAGLVLAFVLARPLGVLSLGDAAAAGLGVRVNRIRVFTAIAIALLCGGATAAAGPITFIGLTVPHIARMIAGADLRRVFAYSVVLAPILLLGADVLGRVVAAPSELPVGIVTAFLGAPVFIALCRTRRLVRL